MSECDCMLVSFFTLLLSPSRLSPLLLLGLRLLFFGLQGLYFQEQLKHEYNPSVSHNELNWLLIIMMELSEVTSYLKRVAELWFLTCGGRRRLRWGQRWAGTSGDIRALHLKFIHRDSCKVTFAVHCYIVKMLFSCERNLHPHKRFQVDFIEILPAKKQLTLFFFCCSITVRHMQHLVTNGIRDLTKVSEKIYINTG